MPSAPSSPLTPSVFSPTTTATTVTSTPVPALTPTTLSHRRNRAGSTSGVDLGPYRVLLSSLEEAAKEHGEQEGEDAGREGEVVGALRMLLDHVDGLTTRLHASLAKQLDTDHQLTIARSNLVMQEAHTEMLEEALRRGGEFSHALIAQTHRRSAPPAAINTSGPASSSHSGLASPVQIERRNSDLASTQEEPGPTPSATASSSSGGGGWFSRRSNSSKKNGFSPIPPSINQPHSPPLHSTSSPRRSNELGMNSHFAASSQPNLGLGLGPISPGSASASPGTSSFANGEIISLKQSLAQERTQRVALGTKLAALQASKAELEEELEGLSQALFEEANKMVADERRVRLEKEEEADEARGERDILRQTVRVVEEDCASLRKIVESLGGRIPSTHSTTANTFDLSSSPTPSTSSLPPLPASPSSRRRAGPPKTLLLSPSLRGTAGIVLSSPSPTSPGYKRSVSGGSPRNSVDGGAGGSDGGGSPRRKGKGVLPLSPRAQKVVDALGTTVVGEEDRDGAKKEMRASASPSIESLDRLMLDMRNDLGSSALDIDTPTTSASFPRSGSPSPSPSRRGGIATEYSNPHHQHLSPPSSPRRPPMGVQRDSGSEGNPWS